MRRIAIKLCLVASFALAASIAACDDVGDDLPPGADASSDSGGDATSHDANAEAAAQDSSPRDSTADAMGDDQSAPDAGTPDGDVPDTSLPDANGLDANLPDSTAQDSGAQDGSVHDATTSDTGLPDASAQDTGTQDTGSTQDTGAKDTGAQDTGVLDTGAQDTGATDSEAKDSGTPDTGVDSGPSPCAAFNGGTTCSPTEQRFVDKSVACYACMVNAGCLDDTLYGDTGHECGDLAGNAAHGAKAGTAKSALCLATIDCIMSPAIECASNDVNICYCGTLGAGNGCATAASGANGQCLQQEVDGLEHSASDAPSAVLPDYTDLTRGAGMANQLFVCASVNGCDALCAK